MDLTPIIERAEGINAWMRENAPHVATEQKHLDEGTPERAYYHFGYLQALLDVVRKAGN